jgi:hypothetical protein
MYLLYSPLEALALNYLSVGFLTVVNNLWTWVAVITAAVSFWRIRAAGGTGPICLKSDVSPPLPRNDQGSIGSQPVPGISVPDVSADEPPAPAPASAMVFGDVKVDDGVTKGTKFVAVYYGEDDGREGDGELTAANEWEENGDDDGVEGCGVWWESWERVLRTRTGEIGWYRYQDLTVLNGNVVRLWDSSTCTRSLRYSSSCVAW